MKSRIYQAQKSCAGCANSYRVSGDYDNGFKQGMEPGKTGPTWRRCFWVKEGLDERRAAGETVANYLRFLRLVNKATSERYTF